MQEKERAAANTHKASSCNCNNKGERREERQKPWRVLVGIGGIAGSGKSTLTERLCVALNNEASSLFCNCLFLECLRDKEKKKKPEKETNDFVTAIGIDGFHFTREELDKFPDPREAHKRRGAPWTLNLKAFWETLQRLKTEAEPVAVPTFDHAKKDPEENGLVVAACTRVVLVEGLYTLLPENEYFSKPNIFDIRIFINTPKSVAADRVIRRHVESGICENEEKAKIRWLENDSLNADYILDRLHLEDIDLIVEGDK